jgi:hypothetical protein
MSTFYPTKANTTKDEAAVYHYQAWSNERDMEHQLQVAISNRSAAIKKYGIFSMEWSDAEAVVETVYKDLVDARSETKRWGYIVASYI